MVTGEHGADRGGVVRASIAATVGIPSRPPLSCRTSPPRGRRSAVIAGFTDVPCAKSVVRLKLPISPSWAGLSHMSDGIDEIVVIPGAFLD
ncbi:hypothetical protein FJ432_24685, partial [Mesorhizobium sp. B2-6-5]